MMRLKIEDINEFKARALQADSSQLKSSFYDQTFIDKIAQYWDFLMKDERSEILSEAAACLSEGLARLLADLLRAASSARIVKTPDSELAGEDNEKSGETLQKVAQSPKSTSFTPPSEWGKSILELLEAIKAIEEPMINVKACQTLAALLASLVYESGSSLPKLKSLAGSEILAKYLDARLFDGVRIHIEPQYYRELSRLLKDALGREHHGQKDILTHILASSPSGKESLRSPHSEKDEKLTSQTQESADDDSVEKTNKLVAQLEFHRVQEQLAATPQPPWFKFFMQFHNPDPDTVNFTFARAPTKQPKHQNMPQEASRYMNLKRRLKDLPEITFVDSPQDYLLLEGLQKSCNSKNVALNIKITAPTEEYLQNAFSRTVEAFNKPVSQPANPKKPRNNGEGRSDHQYSGHQSNQRQPHRNNYNVHGSRYHNNRNANMMQHWPAELPPQMAMGPPFQSMHGGNKYLPPAQANFMGHPVSGMHSPPMNREDMGPSPALVGPPLYSFGPLGHQMPFEGVTNHPGSSGVPHQLQMVGLLGSNQNQNTPAPLTMPNKTRSNQSNTGQQSQPELASRLVKSQLVGTESATGVGLQPGAQQPHRKVNLNPASSSFFQEGMFFGQPPTRDIQMNDFQKIEEPVQYEKASTSGSKKRKQSDFRSPPVEKNKDLLSLLQMKDTLSDHQSPGFMTPDMAIVKNSNPRKPVQKATTLLDFVESGADDRAHKDGRIAQKPKQPTGYRSSNQPQTALGKKRVPGMPGVGNQGLAPQSKDVSANLALVDPSNFPKISEVMDHEKQSESNKTGDPVKKNKPQKAGKK